jgi:hypothetical protein
VPALKAALLEVETHLEWSRERRAQIVLRMDGGFGTTEVLNWLLSRGSQVVAKISHSPRSRGLSEHKGSGHNDVHPKLGMSTVISSTGSSQVLTCEASVT